MEKLLKKLTTLFVGKTSHAELEKTASNKNIMLLRTDYLE